MTSFASSVSMMPKDRLRCIYCRRAKSMRMIYEFWRTGSKMIWRISGETSKLPIE
jgi:hypothetical protein